MAQFDLSSIYTSDKYTSVLDLLKKLINNIDGVQYVAEDEFTSLSSTVSGHTTSIGTLNTNYDALNSTVSGHTTSIGSLNSSYDALSTIVSGFATSIPTLSNSVDKNTTDIKSLRITVSGIHTTYYTHNICILYSATDIKINVSIAMLSTTSDAFDVITLSQLLGDMLSDGKYLNCLCLYNGSNLLVNNIYTSITFSAQDKIITLMTNPTTPSSIKFNIYNATVTDNVTPIV